MSLKAKVVSGAQLPTEYFKKTETLDISSTFENNHVSYLIFLIPLSLIMGFKNDLLFSTAFVVTLRDKLHRLLRHLLLFSFEFVFHLFEYQFISRKAGTYLLIIAFLALN